ncbi:hypothetical protein BH11PSE7_BH11PSE7_30360 [soil metagenome]
MKKLALLSLVLAAGAAFAGEPASFDPTFAPGTNNRAAVQAELASAIKNDTLPQTGEVGEVDSVTKVSASRDVAAVRAEGRLASRAHTTVGEV